MVDFDSVLDGVVTDFAPSKLLPPRNGVWFQAEGTRKIVNEGENAGVLGEDLVGKTVTLYLKRGRVVGVKAGGLERWETSREVANALAFHREFRPFMEESLRLLNFQHKTDNGYLEVQQKDLAYKVAFSGWLQTKKGGYQL